LSPRRGAFVPPHTDDSPLILTTDQRGEGGRGRAWQAQGSERRPHSHGCAHARSARQSRVVFRTLPSSNFVMPNRSVRLFSPGSPLETSQASRSATPSCFRTTAGRKWISGISARRKARRRSCTATRRSWASSSRAERGSETGEVLAAVLGDFATRRAIETRHATHVENAHRSRINATDPRFARSPSHRPIHARGVPSQSKYRR